MARTVRKDIAALEFDGEQFYKGVNKSLREVDKLKTGLTFDQQAESFGRLEKRANRISFLGMSSGISHVNARLSALNLIAASVINNITTGVMRAAKQLFSDKLVKPAKLGLEEYELQINAIQTILANTAKHGTSLSDVSAALDELNAYADKTIYNFGQMTNNIGKFTTAGVELETSVMGIKGIANLAALSGSDANQASMAMYQLSQAIASGTVKLMDWNSVVNAGMGGTLFQDALLDTARAHGVAIDSIIEQEGSFRDSLQRGWLSKEILLDTLATFTGELSDAQLLEMGFMEDQIKQIQSTAQMAVDAATKVKTLTQLKDTALEAVQSGWALTWRQIVGDFDEAQDLFGRLSEIWGYVITQSADSRNNLIHGWVAMGGRQLALDTLFDAIKYGMTIVNNFKEAWSDIFPPRTATDLYRITKAVSELVQKFKMGGADTEKFKNAVRGIAAALDILKMLGQAVLEPIVEYVKSLGGSGGSLLDTASSLGEYVVNLRDAIIETDFFRVSISNAIQWIKDSRDRIKELVNTISELGIVRLIAGGFMLLAKAVPDKFREFSEWARAKIPLVSNVLSNLGIIFNDLVGSAKEIKENFVAAEAFQRLSEIVKSFDGSRIKNFFEEFTGQFDLGIIDGITSKFKELFGFLSSTEETEVFSQSLSSGTTSLFSNVIEQASTIIGDILDAITNGVKDIEFVGLVDALNFGIGAALVASVRSFAGGVWIDKLFEGLKALFGDPSKVITGITRVFGTVQDTMVAFQTNLKADTLQKIAIALAILTGSVLLMSLIDANRLTAAVTAMGVLLAQMFAASAGLSKLSTADLAMTAASIVVISGALAIMSGAVYAMSRMSTEEIQKGMIGIGVALTELYVAVKLFGSGGGKELVASAGAIITLASALQMIAYSAEVFGKMDGDVMEAGLTRVGLALAGLAGFSRTVKSAGMLKAAASVVVISAALYGLSFSLRALGEIPWETMKVGLIGMAASLGIIAIATRIMQTAIPGAVAILIVSGALVVLAQAMSAIANLGWDGLLLALAGLAAVFVVLGVAGLVLAPLTPVLIAMGAAVALLGVGVLALGLGVTLLASALLLIAGSAAVMGGAITIIGTAIMLILPKLAEAIAQAITSFLITIGEAAPEIMQAGVNLLLELVKSISQATPEILTMLLDMLGQMMQTLVDEAPTFLQQGYDLLLTFLQGFADNIQDVVAVGIDIVTGFIRGLTDSLPDLVDATFAFILTFIEAMTDAVEEYMPLLLEAIGNLGIAVVEGLVGAVMNGVPAVIDAARDLAEAALNAIAEKMGIKSPSKVVYDMIKWVPVAMVNALGDGQNSVEVAAANLGSKIQNGIQEAVTGISSVLGEDIELTPTIRPVLDMSNIRKSTTNISGAVAARMTSSIQANQQVTLASAGSDSDGFTFIQNNYSPEPLGAYEVYRQTRSGIAQAKSKRGL